MPFTYQPIGIALARPAGADAGGATQSDARVEQLTRCCCCCCARVFAPPPLTPASTALSAARVRTRETKRKRLAKDRKPQVASRQPLLEFKMPRRAHRLSKGNEEARLTRQLSLDLKRRTHGGRAPGRSSPSHRRGTEQARARARLRWAGLGSRCASRVASTACSDASAVSGPSAITDAPAAREPRLGETTSG